MLWAGGIAAAVFLRPSAAATFAERLEKSRRSGIRNCGQTQMDQDPGAALDNPNAAGADQIAYYYTLRDKDGNLIPGTTDKKDTTVKLKPGSSQEGGSPQKLFPPNPMNLRL